MREWSAMFDFLRNPSRPVRLAMAALALIVPVGVTAAPKTAAAAKAPNGLPWAIALDCGTTEPFWDITVGVDGMWLREFDGRWTKVAAQPSTPKTALRSWKVSHPDGRTGRFTLFDGPGSDGMSDRAYAYRLGVDFGGVKNEGGCDRLPDGSRPARVINVVTDDVLFIRSSPSPAALSVASVAPGGIIWVRPLNEKGGWVPVATVVGTESGPGTVVNGWANGKFLSRRR